MPVSLVLPLALSRSTCTRSSPEVSSAMRFLSILIIVDGLLQAAHAIHVDQSTALFRKGS
jgi:hypothetical protein